MGLSKRYNPDEVEEKRYQTWEEKGYFEAEANSDKEPFSIVIPPPNVTSELHVGHSLQFTLHDIVIRYQRMLGREACWFPGMDHAGIATQNVVEKKLAKEGKTRRDLGREKFIERVWEWKDKYGGKIKEQLKALGTSPDWTRERFTLDEGLSEAVQEAFVRLYEEDYIYRDEYIINWCPRCSTALSDIEVEHSTESGKLYWIYYPLEDTDRRVVVATTRPETMLGDTALALNPTDERAKELADKRAVLPLVGRRLPIITDDGVDPDFGSGIVKITPAHDPVDFEIGNSHDLKTVEVIDREAKIDFPGPYDSMDRYEAREKIVEDLEDKGYLKEIQNYSHSVGHCQRCETIVEPTISKQWFVEMEELAKPAIEAVKKDEVELIPERWKKVYFEWMENIKDWCISRQLWWGHRIPAWYCNECDQVIVDRETPERCPNCDSTDLSRETDVLDTWFSSSLWPFSVMGWPEQTEDLDFFFPTNLLITGFDIIFFWVARMIIMSLHFMEEVPFEQVLLTPLVLDEKGEKMSSSKGNIMDPLEIKEEYGADSLRFTMASSTTKGRGMKLSERKIKDSRNFLNKLWNASRFVLMNLEKEKYDFPEKDKLKLEDEWILSRYNKTVKGIKDELEKYNFKECSDKIYDFIWKDFCDWYLESIKSRLYSDDYDPTPEKLLYHLLKGILKILHPFIPFITEEIWVRLETEEESLMKADFPEPAEEFISDEKEAAMESIQQTIVAIRSIRSDMNIPDEKEVKVMINVSGEKLRETLEKNTGLFQELSKVGEIKVASEIERPSHAARRVLEDLEVLVPLEGLIDIEKERKRIREEVEKLEDQLETSNQKLNDEDFLSKAPKEIVDKEKEKAEEFKDKRDRLLSNLEVLKEN